MSSCECSEGVCGWPALCQEAGRCVVADDAPRRAAIRRAAEVEKERERAAIREWRAAHPESTLSDRGVVELVWMASTFGKR